MINSRRSNSVVLHSWVLARMDLLNITSKVLPFMSRKNRKDVMQNLVMPEIESIASLLDSHPHFFNDYKKFKMPSESALLTRHETKTNYGQQEI